MKCRVMQSNYAVFCVLILACIGLRGAEAENNDSAKNVSGSNCIAEACLMFSDDFDYSDGPPGTNWVIHGGSWKIKDRELWVENGNGAWIQCAAPVGRNMRVEFSCLLGNEGDCNIVLPIKPQGVGRRGYMFGFGDNYDTARYNQINFAGRVIAKEDAHAPKPNQWYQLMAEKRGPALKMFVNGEPIMSAVDTNREPVDFIQDGDQFAFQIWGNTRIDNIRAWALPAEKEEEEPRAVVREYAGFENDVTNQTPSGFIAGAGSGAGPVKIMEFPTWKSGATIQDKCVRLEGREGKPAELTRAFAPIESGFAEMDIMAEKYLDKPLQIAFLDEDGRELAVISTDAAGTFYAGTGEKPLRMEYAPKRFNNRGLTERIYLRPSRWFTLRIGFNCKTQTCYLALVNYMSFGGPMADWMELARDIPFLKPGGKVSAVRIQALDRAVLYVDNFCVYGPVHPYIVNGMDYRLPAKKLLDLNYQDRRDPPVLRNHSYRFFEIRADQSPEFKAAGIRYSELMVKQAFVNESFQKFERAAYYLKERGELDNKTASQAGVLSNQVARTEEMLDTLYRTYARAYLNRLDTNLLSRTFPDKALALERQLDEADRAVTDILRMLAEFSAPEKGKGILRKLLRSLMRRSTDQALNLEPAAAGGSALNCFWDKGKGCFRQEDRPAYLYPCGIGGREFSPEFYRILDLPKCFRVNNVTKLNEKNLKPGEYFAPHPWIHPARFTNALPDATFHYTTPFLHNGQVTEVPAWWLDQNASDPDIYLSESNGKPLMPGKRFEGQVYLNICNPKVHQFFTEASRDVAVRLKAEYPGRTKLYNWSGGEENLYLFYMAFQNPPIQTAFVDYLRGVYTNIAVLNEKWNTSYSSFDDIRSAKADNRQQSGLCYERYRFQIKAYCDVIRDAKKGFNSVLPDVPITGYMYFPMLHNFALGGDITQVFDVLDIYTHHSYLVFDYQPINRCMDSMRKVCPEKGAGILEWGSAHVNNSQMFDEECYKANGLAMLFLSMAWGQTLHDIWATEEQLGYDAALPECRLGWNVLRYQSSFVPLTMNRVRRLGRPALEYPTIRPDVGILEILSGAYYGMKSGMDTRQREFQLSQELEKAGWNYGYLFERYLLEGRQSLQGYATIVAPPAVCCPPELADQLMDWTQKGGTLILLGPMGLYDQYGKPDNHFLKAVFGCPSWKFAYTWEDKAGNILWAPEGGSVEPVDRESGIYQADFGKGKVILFAKLGNLDKPYMWDKVLEQIAGHTRRAVDCSNPDFKYVMRESQDVYYLYIVNMNTRPLE